MAIAGAEDTGATELSVGDNFEGYSVDEPIAGHGDWRETALGQQPANRVRSVNVGGRETHVLQAAGSGDHRDLFMPDAAAWEAATTGPVVMMRFMARVEGAHGSVQMSFGSQSKYQPQQALTVLAGRRLGVRLPDGTFVQGLTRFDRGDWYEVGLVMELDQPSAGQATLRLGYRNVTRGDKQMTIDAALEAVVVDLSPQPIKKWNGYRMLAEGYYHAEVAGWNPWSVPDEVYDFGQLMPDYLIAVQPFTRAFHANERVTRTVHVYNQLFEDRDVELIHELIVDDAVVSQGQRRFELHAGQRHSLRVRLQMPSVQQRTDVEWRLTLRTDSEVLAERVYDYTALPRVRRLAVPNEVALLMPEDEQTAGSLVDVQFPRGTHRGLDQALASGATSVVLAGVKLSAEEGAKLERAVQKGLRVLWLEAPAQSWLPAPLQIDPRQRAAYVFVRSPHDPLLAGLAERDLRYWGADTLTTQHSVFKPDRGRFDALLDAGGPAGMNTAAMLRLHRGQGAYLVCQMPVLSKADVEPAAMAMLARLLGSLDETMVHDEALPLALAAASDSPLRERLVALDVPFVEAASQPVGVLVVDASASLPDDRLSLIADYLEAGHDVLMQRLGTVAAEQLAVRLGVDVTVSPSEAQQLVHRVSDPLLDGFSHDDWYWVESGEDVPAIISGALNGDEHWRMLTRPAGLAVREMGEGRLIVS